MNPQLKLYESLGWKLVALVPDKKRPIANGWNKSKKSEKVKPGQNVGVKLLYSGLCCFDIDNLSRFKSLPGGKEHWKSIKRGLRWTSGKKNRVKILFQLPRKKNGKVHKLLSCALGENTGEFRCMNNNGKTMQDVLPPSVLNDGRVYHWLGKNSFTDPPVLPYELFKLFIRRTKFKTSGDYGHWSAPYVKAYNEWAGHISIESLIAQIPGYTRVMGGFKRNGSDNNLAIALYGDSAFNYSTNEDQSISEGPIDKYNLFVLVEHGGDEVAARKWVCTELRAEVDYQYELSDNGGARCLGKAKTEK